MSGRARRSRRSVLFTSLATALVLGLVVANVLLTSWTREQRQTDTDRSEAARAARLAVSALTSRDFEETERLDAATSRLLSDRFRAVYLESRAESLAAGKGGAVMVTTDATRAAVERITSDRAVVLVSADAMRTTRKGKHQGLAHYRMRVTLVHEGGTWLVDDLVAI